MSVHESGELRAIQSKGRSDMKQLELVFLCGLLGLGAAPAGAASLVWELEDGPESGGFPFNTTLFKITNTSGPGVALTSFGLTIGDPQYLFDYLAGPPIEKFIGGVGTETSTLATGDRVDDNAGVSAFLYQFDGFQPGMTFQGEWDIDKTSNDFVADARQVLFNNGEAPNAMATFHFSDGSQVGYTFGDLPVQGAYLIAIPEPSAVALLGLGGAVALWRKRSQRKRK